MEQTEGEDELFFSFVCESSDSSSDEDVCTECYNYLLIAKDNRHVINNYCSDVIPKYTDREFLSHFRINREVFEELRTKFANCDIYKKIIQADNSAYCISAERHMLTFLWYAGHQTSYREVADRFDLSLSSLFDIIDRVSMFLSNLAPEVIQLPNEEEKINTRAYYKDKVGIPHIVGSIDGSHIQIEKPHERAIDYYNRHDFYSVILQAVCNEKCKFIDVFIGYPGSVHDARVYKNSPLYEVLPTLGGGYLLGDSAYPLSPHLIIPYRDNGHLTAAQKYFNKKHSSARVSIEHSFGILKQRFRQLYHVKLRSMPRICHFIRACCVLHNLAQNEIDLEFELDDGVELDNQPLPNEEPIRAINVEGRTLRNELCEHLYRNR